MVETEVRLSWLDDVTAVLALVGEHDLGTVDLVRSVVQEPLKRASYFILDLSETTFIDSAAIAQLLRLERKCQKKGIHFQVVVGDASNTWRVLDISGISRSFETRSSIQEAVKAISANGVND